MATFLKGDSGNTSPLSSSKQAAVNSAKLAKTALINPQELVNSIDTYSMSISDVVKATGLDFTTAEAIYQDALSLRRDNEIAENQKRLAMESSNSLATNVKDIAVKAGGKTMGAFMEGRGFAQGFLADTIDTVEDAIKNDPIAGRAIKAVTNYVEESPNLKESVEDIRKAFKAVGLEEGSVTSMLRSSAQAMYDAADKVNKYTGEELTSEGYQLRSERMGKRIEHAGHLANTGDITGALAEFKDLAAENPTEFAGMVVEGLVPSVVLTAMGMPVWAAAGISEGAGAAGGAEDFINNMSDKELLATEYGQANKDMLIDELRSKMAIKYSTDVGFRTGLMAALVTRVVGSGSEVRAAGQAKNVAKDKLVKEGVTENVDTLAAKAAKITPTKAIKETAQEGFEEGLTSGTGQLVENVTKQEYVDKDTLAGENILGATVEGTVLGAAGGGGISAVAGTYEGAKKVLGKGKSKAIDALVKYQKKYANEEESNVGTAFKEAASTEDFETLVKDISKESVEDAKWDKVQGVLLNINEKLNDETLPKEERKKLKAQRKILSKLVDEKTAELKTKVDAAVNKVMGSEPVTAEDSQLALMSVMSGENTTNEELLNKLSGSEHITPLQQKLIEEVRNPKSAINKVIKNQEEVAQDKLEGGEGFRGLTQYISSVAQSIAAGNETVTAFSLLQLKNFQATQAAKIASGKFRDGNTIPAPLMERIKQESEAIDTTFNALLDSAKQTFPNINEAMSPTSAKKKVDSELTKAGLAPEVDTTSERKTVPTATRVALAKQALSRLLNPAYKGAEGTEDALKQTRLDLVNKYGVTKEQIGSLNNAIRAIERITPINVSNRTDEDRQELKQAHRAIDDLYTSLIDNYGSVENFAQALEEQGESVQDILATIPEAVELVTETESERGHVPVSTVNKNISSAKQITTYNEMVAALREHAENNKVTDEQQEAIDNLPEIDELSSNTKEAYNTAANLVNTLKVENADVPVGQGKSIANSTTPSNRVFRNVFESLPFNSTLRKAFRFVGNGTGLLKTEENLVAKLRAVDSGIYKHITRQMHSKDKEDLAVIVKFLADFQARADKVVVKPGEVLGKVNTEEAALNHIVNEFVGEDGKLDPNVAAVLGMAFGSWLQNSGYDSLYNDDKRIAKILGKSDNYEPTDHERKILSKAGVLRSLVHDEVGAEALKMLGLELKGDQNEDLTKQLITGLGVLAVHIADNVGNIGMLETQFVVYDDKGNVVSISDKPSAKAAPFIKVKATTSTAENPSSPIVSRAANYIEASRNENVVKTILGATDRIEKVYMEGEEMPSASRDAWNSPKAAKAIDANSNQEYEVHEEFIDIALNVLDEDHQRRLIDDVPAEGTEHKDNTVSNAARRQAITDQIDGLKRIIQRMKDTGSKTVRFLSRSSKKNKRMTQLGTDGSPQNHKLVRHSIKLSSQRVTIDPTNTVQMLAFKFAVTEALDYASPVSEGVRKSTDKAPDAAVEAGFEEVLNDPVISKAVQSIRNRQSGNFTEQDAANIQAALKGSATAIVLDGLLALAAYDANKPFEVFVGKENDGITNGIAIGLMQLAGVTSFEEYLKRLERTGIYSKENGINYKGYGDWASKEGNQDSYETFSKRMTELLTNVEDNPYSDTSVTPTVIYGKNSTFKIPASILKKLKAAPKFPHLGGNGDTIDTALAEVLPSKDKKKKNPNVKWTKQKGKWVKSILTKNKKWLQLQQNQKKEWGYYRNGKWVTNAAWNKQEDYVLQDHKLTIPVESHRKLTGVIDYFLNNKVYDEASGQVRSLKEVVEEITRNFAKDPLMIFNYGAGIEGLKQSIAGSIIRGITASLEEANTLEGKAREDAIKVIEEGVNALSPYGLEKPWKVADNLLETDIGNDVFDAARLSVEFTYGAAMEKAFEEQYGKYKTQINRVIVITRLATVMYAKALDKAIAAKKKETGKDYITPDERKEIEESLREYSPMIATAISEDRTKDGVWVPKGEHSYDGGSGKDSDRVVIPVKSKDGKPTNVRSTTFSNKIKDPGVSMGAVMVQSLDASVIVNTILKGVNFVNVHDAAIFNLLSNAKDGSSMNEAFAETMDYSLMDAVVEMYEGVLSNPALTEDDLSAAYKEINGNNDTLVNLFGSGDLLTALKEVQAATNHNRGLLNETTIDFHQYNSGETGSHTRTPAKSTPLEELSDKWIDDTPTVTRKERFTEIVLNIKKSFSPARLKNVLKDYAKIEVATKFIGKGVKGSSTEIYEGLFAEEGLANTGSYSKDDVVFVSANGNRSGAIEVVDADGNLTESFADIDKAIAAGAAFVTDSILRIESSTYNVGDNKVLNYLRDNGYQPVTNDGVAYWLPAEGDNSIAAYNERVNELREQEQSANVLEDEYARLGNDVELPEVEPVDTLEAFLSELEDANFDVLALTPDTLTDLTKLAKSEDVEYLSQFAEAMYDQNTLEPVMPTPAPEVVQQHRDKELLSLNNALRSKKMGKVFGALFEVYPKDTREGKLLAQAQKALGEVKVRFYPTVLDIPATDGNLLAQSESNINYLVEDGVIHVFGWKNPTKLDATTYAAILTEAGIDTNAEPLVTDVVKSSEYSAVVEYSPRTTGTKAVKRFLVRLMRGGLSYKEAKAKVKSTTKYQKEAVTVFKNLDKKVSGSDSDVNETYEKYTSDEAQEAAAKFEVNDFSIKPIFDRLGAVESSVKPSQWHLNALSSLIDTMAPVIGTVAAVFHKGANKTRGFKQGAVVNVIRNSGAKANGIEMSPQEVYAHELLHTVLDKADKNSRAYKEIERLYDIAVKTLTVEDFLGDIENPTEADLAEAKMRYEHTLFNRVAGGGSRTTALGEEVSWYNSDPVEEFAVMAATNEAVMKVVMRMQDRLPKEPKTFLEQLMDAIKRVLKVFTSTIEGYDENNPTLEPLIRELTGIKQQKENMIYRSIRAADKSIDATSKFVKDALGKTPVGTMIANRDSLGFNEIKEQLRQKIGKHAIGKNKLAIGIANEFTTGRKGLAALVRLLTKSTYEIERRSQHLQEGMVTEINEILGDLTEEQNHDLYVGVLNTDLQSLTKNYSPDEILEFLTDNNVRIARIQELKDELFKVAPTSAKYMVAHSQDLGYNMITGDRLLDAGMYTNAYQIANMWGYEGRVGNIDKVAAEAIVDELATLHAIGYSNTNLSGIFTSNAAGTRKLELVTAIAASIVETARDTSFADNQYNMRKGYVRERFDANIDVKTGTLKDEARMSALGYTRQGEVKGDPTLKEGAKKYYYVSTDGAPTKYLTGVASLASTETKGIDLFQIGDGSETSALSALIAKETLKQTKQSALKQIFAGKSKPQEGKDRGRVAEPEFDSHGNIKGYRYTMSAYNKDKMLKRETNFGAALGYTLAGITRRNKTKLINEILLKEMHDTYQREYQQYPQEFIKITANSKDKAEREAYKLMPEEAKMYAKQLWGEEAIYVRREQFDIVFGYRKFSVSQLRYDNSEATSAVQAILKHTNNLATLMFNNQVGISIEKYWQAFVVNAKDTIVIKSGVVTAANIASNVMLLWWSGVPFHQAVKDHYEAYKATFAYRETEKEIFSIEYRLTQLEEGTTAYTKALGKRNALRQKLYNNPVRELMEAGMFQAIVDDVEVGEHVTPIKDKFDTLVEPVVDKVPETVKTIGKNLLLTHDTKAYKVMRDMAQISDFAARYSLHKHNMAKGMDLQDSLRDVSTTFINYDIPTHKGIQYLNDIGMMGFTKYLFRTQQVLIKRFGENPARIILSTILQSMGGMNVPDPGDAALTGVGALMSRFYDVSDWVSGASQTLPLNILFR